MVRRFFDYLAIAGAIGVIGLWWWGGGECHKAKERWSGARYTLRHTQKETTDKYYRLFNRVNELEAEAIEACSEK
jgi:hypothetical protein